MFQRDLRSYWQRRYEGWWLEHVYMYAMKYRSPYIAIGQKKLDYSLNIFIPSCLYLRADIVRI